MTVTRTNAIIAAVLALVNSIIPFLQIVGVLDLTSDGMAALYLIISNLATVVGLVFASSPATNVPDA